MNLLQATDFTSVLQNQCPDSAYKDFMQLYKDAFNIAFPISTTKYIKQVSETCTMDHQRSNPIFNNET